MPPVQYRSRAMDHLGLVAGMCKELGIADHIDRHAPKVPEEWHISHGEAVVAMIINGLGFTVQSLHMFPQFFANKPLDKLTREGIEPEHMNDKVLVRALDELFELDVSKVYFELLSRWQNILNCHAMDVTTVKMKPATRILIVPGFARVTAGITTQA